MTVIEFAEWILQQSYSPVTTPEGNRWGGSRIGSTTYSTIQLYSLFLEYKKTL